MPPPQKSAFAWTLNLKKRLVAETSIDDFASLDLNNNVQPTPTFRDSSSQTHPNRGYESELSNLGMYKKIEISDYDRYIGFWPMNDTGFKSSPIIDIYLVLLEKNIQHRAM